MTMYSGIGTDWDAIYRSLGFGQGGNSQVDSYYGGAMPTGESFSPISMYGGYVSGQGQGSAGSRDAYNSLWGLAGNRVTQGQGGSNSWNWGVSPQLGGFSFGGGGANGTGGGAAGDPGVYGSSYGGTFNGVTQGGNAAAGGGMGSGWSNPELWGTVAGAGLDYLGARENNKNAAAANRPQPYWEQTTPYGPAQGNIDFGLAELMRRYQNQPRVPGGGRGGGGGYSSGIDSGMQGLLNSITQRGMGVPEYIQAAQGVIPGMVQGGGSNPYLQGTYSAAQNFSNPYLDQFIGSMGGAFLPGGSGRGKGATGGGAGYGWQSGGGGNQKYKPNKYLTASLEGNWLKEGNPYLDEMISGAGRELREQYMNELAPAVDSEYQRAGRYGSGAYQQAQSGAAEEFGESLADMISGLRGSSYENERQRMQDSLGLLTSSENATIGANAQRAAAGMGASAQRYAADLQNQLGNRGLLLDAINGVSNNNQFGLGMMGDMASLFTNERLGALGAVPGLEQAGWMGATNAWGANTDAAQMRVEAQARNQAAAQERWAMAQQMDQQRFRDLLDYSGQFGQAFGRTGGERAPNTYTPTQNEWARALQGGLIGYMGMRA